MFEFVFFIACLGMLFAASYYYKVKNHISEGTPEMVEIAANIRQGSRTFLFEEYKDMAIVVLLVSIGLGVIIQESCFAFLLGIFLSGAAGFVGMKASTFANVRVANTARETRHLGKTTKVGLKGGAVMGLCVSSFFLVGLCIVFFLYHYQYENLGLVTNWAGMQYDHFSMTISAYVLGCSTTAMFNRVGGGIFTKAADMGADLAGKNEQGIPEDDPRNPAVIADNVGDNVGDTAGLGSDLLESYGGSMTSCILFVIFLFIRYDTLGYQFDSGLADKLIAYPVLLMAIGLLSCIIGFVYIFSKKDEEEIKVDVQQTVNAEMQPEEDDFDESVEEKKSKQIVNNPRNVLNTARRISAGLTAVLGLALTIVLFKGENFGDLPLRFGEISLYLPVLLGIVAGMGIGAIAEYYTSSDYKPTRKIVSAAKEGAATVVTQGLAVGFKSTLAIAGVLAGVIILSNAMAGALGVGIAAVGMLSFISITVAVDTFGPICDNAGGIAEMANLDEGVRYITDKLDSIGNTTAAIGKGFSIGSAALTAMALMISYMYSFTPIDQEVNLNILDSFVLGGTLIGAALPFFFSGDLIEEVTNAAKKMVDEVRRQFRTIVGLKEGTAKPEHKRCMEISTRGALSSMRFPALLAILTPVVLGLIFGPMLVAGMLLGSFVTGIMLAVFSGNSGGAWDNAKKWLEANGKKKTDAHKASVIGDTVGDPLKDTSGPSINILIKMMSITSIIMAPVYAKFNLMLLLFK